MLQDDLYAFHVRVFGATGAPSHLIPVEGESSDDRTLVNAGGEDMDDLGYYPDGVKRTLTDEQVAMFRHSEIYSILRARQVLQENRQADGYDSSDSQLSDGEEVLQTRISSDNIAGATPVQDTIYKSSKSRAEAQNDTNDLISKPAGTNKRKRHRGDSGVPQSQGYSFRRTARELDSLMEVDQVLDYGDDPSSKLDNQTEVSDRISMVPPVSAVAEPISSASSVIRNPPVKGKKIWWPVVGT